MTETICGRNYEIIPPGKQGNVPVYSKARKPYPKVCVEGMNHGNGNPIRFRSVANAERHIRNMTGET